MFWTVPSSTAVMLLSLLDREGIEEEDSFEEDVDGER